MRLMVLHLMLAPIIDMPLSWLFSILSSSCTLCQQQAKIVPGSGCYRSTEVVGVAILDEHWRFFKGMANVLYQLMHQPNLVEFLDDIFNNYCLMCLEVIPTI